jgi:5-methylthioadenosine/S-adenosylhomocysteine deaminase
VKVLIAGGYVLAQPGADVLIENGVITAVGAGLTAEGATVLDATGKVVIPGFVDTHRHMAHAPLRGIGADMNLDEYLAKLARRYGVGMDIEQVRASTRLCAAEAINAGITTVLDWNGLRGPGQADAVLDASVETGLRVLFGDNPDDEATTRKHAAERRIAIAAMGPDYLSIEDTARHIGFARELGVITTMHVGGGVTGANTESVTRLHDHGLLGPDLNFVHGNRIGDDEIKMIADSGGSLTVTPNVELTMGHGALAFQRFKDAGGVAALGVDVIVNNSPDMFGEMHTLLMFERSRNGTWPLAATMLQAATIDSANAIRMGDQVGSLEVGKRADVVLLSGLEHLLGEGPDVVAGGVVTSTGTQDVDTVLIDGRIVKRDGVLADYDLRELRAATVDIARRTLAG